MIRMVVNTPSVRLCKLDDSYIRKAVIKRKIPFMTNTAAAIGIEGGSGGDTDG